MTDNNSFQPGVALIFGGSGVIGSAIARRLAQSGCDLAITYRSNPAPALALAEELGASGISVTATAVDNEDPVAVRAFVDGCAARFGAVQSVVYAAGPRIMFNLVNQITPEEWSRVIDADVKGCFNVVAAVLPHLREQKRGSLLAILTAAVDRSPPRDILSAGPKAAIQMLFRSIALEEGRNGIRANCVAPGFILDGMGTSMIGDHDQAFAERMIKAIPLRRAGLATDIAESACFLLSEQANYVTGSTLHVAGGLHLA